MYTITDDRTEAAATSIISLSGVASVTWRNVGRHRGTRRTPTRRRLLYSSDACNSLYPSPSLSFSLSLFFPSARRPPYVDDKGASRPFTYSKPLVVENLLDGDPMIYVGREHSLYEVFRRLANGIPEWRLHLRIQLNRNYSRSVCARMRERASEPVEAARRTLLRNSFFP